MQITPIKTRILTPPQDDLWSAILDSGFVPKEKDVLVVASKVVAIAEGRSVKRDSTNRDILTKQESDWFVSRDKVPGRVVMHAILHGQLAVFAGTDPFGDWLVLWPEKPMQSAEKLCTKIKAHFNLTDFGLIISDSKSTPLRRGVVGGAIAWAGFDPLFDNRKRFDLTGRETGGGQINVADSIATAAVLVMGEGTEQTPLVVVKEAPYVFTENTIKKDKHTSYVVPKGEDIFAPFFNTDVWERGGRSSD